MKQLKKKYINKFKVWGIIFIVIGVLGLITQMFFMGDRFLYGQNTNEEILFYLTYMILIIVGVYCLRKKEEIVKQN